MYRASKTERRGKNKTHSWSQLQYKIPKILIDFIFRFQSRTLGFVLVT